MRVVAWITRLLAISMAAALLFGAVITAIAPRAWGVGQAWRATSIELPGFQQLAQQSVAVDAQGDTIAVFRRENSRPIELSSLSPEVIDAFLAVEDREFYNHNGIDVRGLFRASVSNVASDGADQGASTITMQVAKLEYLGGFDRDFRYKVLQIHYALMLEDNYTKDEILQRYLNTVYFGNNAYGIEAAAETYFGKHAADLTAVEGAFLAGLVRSPSGFDPINRPERSRARFTQVINLLAGQGMFGADEAAALVDWESETAFQIPARAQSFPEETPPRTYFSEALTDYLLNRSDILGATYNERFARLYRGGLTIETTLNPTFQQRAEVARDVLPDNGTGIDAALISIDSRTGAIRAMVGGRSFSESEVNMTLRTRQTGSAAKFFILAAALQAGAQGNDLVDGTRPCTLPNPGDPSDPFEITSGVSRATDTVAAMTWYSINCAYGRMAQIVGLNRVVSVMYAMAESPYLYPGQHESERFPIMPYPSMATGGNEMSPLDMASGAQTIANGGLHRQPYYVERITDRNGDVVYEHDDPGVQVLDRGVALEAVDILKGVLRQGTGRHHSISVPAAGKTGTQHENTNAWFVGFTPNLTTAVWVGDPDGHTAMTNIPEFNVGRVQGGGYPTAIWANFMEATAQFFGPDDWDAPPPPARPPARLYLPGNECLSQVTGYSGGGPVPPPGDRSGADTGGQDGTPTGWRNPAQPPDPGPEPEPEPEPAPEPAPAQPQQPAPTQPRTPITAPVDGGTTIPPDVLDPNVPIPSVLVSQGLIVRPC